MMNVRPTRPLGLRCPSIHSASPGNMGIVGRRRNEVILRSLATLGNIHPASYGFLRGPFASSRPSSLPRSTECLLNLDKPRSLSSRPSPLRRSRDIDDDDDDDDFGEISKSPGIRRHRGLNIMAFNQGISRRGRVEARSNRSVSAMPSAKDAKSIDEAAASTPPEHKGVKPPPPVKSLEEIENQIRRRRRQLEMEYASVERASWRIFKEIARLQCDRKYASIEARLSRCARALQPMQDDFYRILLAMRRHLENLVESIESRTRSVKYRAQLVSAIHRAESLIADCADIERRGQEIIPPAQAAKQEHDEVWQAFDWYQEKYGLIRDKTIEVAKSMSSTSNAAKDIKSLGGISLSRRRQWSLLHESTARVSQSVSKSLHYARSAYMEKLDENFPFREAWPKELIRTKFVSHHKQRQKTRRDREKNISLAFEKDFVKTYRALIAESQPRYLCQQNCQLRQLDAIAPLRLLIEHVTVVGEHMFHYKRILNEIRRLVDDVAQKRQIKITSDKFAQPREWASSTTYPLRVLEQRLMLVIWQKSGIQQRLLEFGALDLENELTLEDAPRPVTRDKEAFLQYVRKMSVVRHRYQRVKEINQSEPPEFIAHIVRYGTPAERLSPSAQLGSNSSKETTRLRPYSKPKRLAWASVRASRDQTAETSAQTTRTPSLRTRRRRHSSAGAVAQSQMSRPSRRSRGQ